MLNIFKKKTVITGLESQEVLAIRSAIVNEYDNAKRRQVRPDAGPNQYMVGLRKALSLLDAIPIHTIAEVRK